jgi:hypothetical protein
MKVSINADTPIAGWLNGKSYESMADESGYPYFRKPPHG